MKDSRFSIELTIGGSHLLNRFGHTIDMIKADGFVVDHIADFLGEDDTSSEDISAAYARAVTQFHNILSSPKNQADFVFILGDRWEMQAVATVANMLGLPVAHHSGGDITEGSADNQTRYIMSTLSHLHFTSLPEHKRRLEAMGEEEWRVHAVGEPALKQISDINDKALSNFYMKTGLSADDKFALATFHPTSFDDLPFIDQQKLFLETLDHIHHKIVLTAPNPDPASLHFYQSCIDYAASSEGRVLFFESLGSQHYYTAMRLAVFMIGNSSSGLWEASSFKLPVINMGRRQDGRVRSINVIDVDLDLASIVLALSKVNEDEFNNSLSECQNPYVMDNGLSILLDVLHKNKTHGQLLAKKFKDPLKRKH